MKRWMGIAVATAATVALLSGCAPSAPTASTSGKDVTLTYAVWSQDATMQKLIDQFEKENPTIHVNLQVDTWTDYWTKLQVAATAGKAPDAFWMLGDHFQTYASNNQLLVLDKAIKDAKIDMSVYPSALVKLFNYKGHQYGLPKDFDTVGLWYNKKMFDAAGVKYPDDTWTWADVEKNAKLLTNPANGTFGIAAPYNRQEGFYNTVAQAGGDIISADQSKSGYNKAGTQAGIQFWINLLKDGSSPTLAQMSDTEAVAQFENQKVAMYYGGSFYASRFYQDTALRPNVDVTVLPKGETRATTINGIQNVGSSKSAHPAELTKFLLFLGGKEAAKIQAATGAVIPAYKNTQQGWIDSMPEFNLQAFMDEIPYGVVYPVSGNTAAWNALEDADLTPVWQLTTSVKDGADKLATGMNEKLKAEK
ncbi:MAG: multiple sugar transport system substrate-binding protein [Microbacteriaceae bacterium]|nr:multiple sugar transport system substrate-binding protein [Microbacteriaceae bacterium]